MQLLRSSIVRSTSFLGGFEHTQVRLNAIAPNSGLKTAVCEKNTFWKIVLAASLTLISYVLWRSSETQVAAAVVPRVSIRVVNLHPIRDFNSEQPENNSVCYINQIVAADADLYKNSVPFTIPTFSQGWLSSGLTGVVGEPHVPNHLTVKVFQGPLQPCEFTCIGVVGEAFIQEVFGWDSFDSSSLDFLNRQRLRFDDSRHASINALLADRNTSSGKLCPIESKSVSTITAAKPPWLAYPISRKEGINCETPESPTTKVYCVVMEFDFTRLGHSSTLGFNHCRFWLSSSERQPRSTAGVRASSHNLMPASIA